MKENLNMKGWINMKNIKGFVNEHKKGLKRVAIGGVVVLIAGVLYKVLHKDEDEIDNFEMTFDEPVDVNYVDAPTEQE